jgi:myo-inositol-1(or 4)-monophosphatase
MLNTTQLKDIATLVYEVGVFQLEEQQKLATIEIIEKSPNQLVSYVDTESEKKLVAGLLAATPSAGFLTEEETTTLKNEDLYWIIDPVDGTTNFLFGHTKFCISIALYAGGRPVYANVYVPADEEMFTADASGAYLNGELFTSPSHRGLTDSLIATGFPYYKFDEMEQYLAMLRVLMQETKGLRRMGSAAIDLVYTAYGRFDGFFELNLSPWDVAGGAYIVQQAGGVVTDFKATDNYVFGASILAASKGIYEELLEVVRDVDLG